MILNKGEGKKDLIFTDACKRQIQHACMLVETKFEAVRSGNVVVQDLQYINDHLETFVESIAILKKNENVGKEEVRKTVKLRLKEVEEFTQQQGQMKHFVSLCQHASGTYLSQIVYIIRYF